MSAEHSLPPAEALRPSTETPDAESAALNTPEANPLQRKVAELSEEQFDEFVLRAAELGSSIDNEDERLLALQDLAQTEYGIRSLDDVEAITRQFIERNGLTPQAMILADSDRTITSFRANNDNPFHGHKSLLLALDAAFENPAPLPEPEPALVATSTAEAVHPPESQLVGGPAAVTTEPTVGAEPSSIEPISPSPEPAPIATSPEATPQPAPETHQAQLERFHNGVMDRWIVASIKDIANIPDLHERGQKIQELRSEFERRTAELTPEDGVDDQLGGIRLLLGLESLDRPDVTPPVEPSPPEPRPVDEALEDFRRQNQENNPGLRSRMRNLWEARTTKAGTDIKETGAIREHEANPYGPDELRGLRAQLAAMRAYERRTAIRKINPEDMQTVEAQYAEALAGYILRQLTQEKQTDGLNNEQLRTRAVEMLIADQKSRSELELAVIEQRGGKGVKAANWLRNHPKMRVAIGVGLAAGSVGLAATGFGLPAVAVGVARAGMRGFGGYEAAQGIQGKFGSRRAHGSRQNISERNLGSVDAASLPPLDERTQRLANLLAMSAAEGRGQKHEKQDNEATQVLLNAQHRDYLDSLRASEDPANADHLLADVDIAARIFLAEQLGAENARLVSDKEVGRKRFKRAVAVGAILALAPIGASAVEHLTGHGAPAGGGAGESSGPHDSIPSPGTDYAPESPGGAEAPAGDFQDRNWTVKPGESQWRIAHKILSYHPNSFGGMSAQEKLVAIDRLKDLMGSDNLVNPGEHIKVTGAMVKDALNYKN